MSDLDIARAVVIEAGQRAGVTITPLDVEAAAQVIVGVFALVTGQALAKANAAGVAAAAQVQTVEQANAVMAAAADKEQK